jgi:hypothetical protein
MYVCINVYSLILITCTRSVSRMHVTASMEISGDVGGCSYRAVVLYCKALASCKYRYSTLDTSALFIFPVHSIIKPTKQSKIEGLFECIQNHIYIPLILKRLTVSTAFAMSECPRASKQRVWCVERRAL